MLKLMMLDMDGTLFDTSYVNYYSYKEVVGEYGYSLEYEFYREICNGRHYKEFLPLFSTEDVELMEIIHNKKKAVYPKYLDKARLNTTLLDSMRAAKSRGVHTCLVTTANKQNVIDILKCFEIYDDFELILTQEDIINPKPDPEGFLKAMHHFDVKPSECLIFEDSTVGLEAAKRSGADYMQVYNYR